MTIDLLAPEVRCRLVESRRTAMMTGSGSVVQGLIAYADTAALPLEARCHVRMVAAELAYLDGDTDAALRATDLPDDDLRSLPPLLRVTLLDNRAIVRLMSLRHFDSGERLRNSDERQRLTERHDSSAELVHALRAVRAGKHFEALPQFRAVLLASYWSGDWRLLREAASELSGELLSLGQLSEAAYLSILACDEAATKSVANAYLKLSDGSDIDRAVRHLTLYGRLRQHARLVSVFLAGAADAIPDDLVDPAADYLLRWVHLGREFMTPLNASASAWEALRQLGGRVSTELADRAITAGTQAAVWHFAPPALGRDLIVRACSALVTCCSDARLASFAPEVITLTQPEQRSHDYEDVLELLWQISIRSQEAKDAVTTALFPGPGTSAPASLLQLGSLLGKKLGSVEELNGFVQRLAGRVRVQVVELEPGAEAPPVDGFGTFSYLDGDRRIVLQLSNFGPSFEGVLACIDQLSGETVTALVDALLAAISSPFNALANKSELVHYLGRTTKRLTGEAVPRVHTLLLPLARGVVVDRAAEGTGRAADPLNRFKFDLGTVEDLQGQALVAIARLNKSHPGRATEEIHGAIASGLAHTNPTVRQLSYAAAGLLSESSDSIVTGLLVGTRDTDPDAAAAALGVFAYSDGIGESELQSDYLMQAIHIASLSSARQMRESAGAVLRRLKHLELSQSQGRSATEIAARLARDPLASVRRSLSEGSRA